MKTSAYVLLSTLLSTAMHGMVMAGTLKSLIGRVKPRIALNAATPYRGEEGYASLSISVIMTQLDFDNGRNEQGQETVSLWGAVSLQRSENIQQVQIVDMPNLGWDVECTLTSIPLPLGSAGLNGDTVTTAEVPFSWAEFCDAIPDDQKLVLPYPKRGACQPANSVICTQRAVLSDIPRYWLD